MRSYRDGIVIANQHYVVETRSLKDNVVGDLPYYPKVFRDCLRDHGFDIVLEKIAGRIKPRRMITNPAEEVILNQDGIELSPGERKSLGVFAADYRLRVAPKTVKMVLLDEPTSEMDRESQKKLYPILRRWMTGEEYKHITILTINHDLELMKEMPETTRVLGMAVSQVFDGEKPIGTLVEDQTLEKARVDTSESSVYRQLFGK